MDLVLLFYWALVLMGGVMLYICSKTHYLKGPIGKTQIFPYIISECLRRAMLRFLHFLFHTRNHTFIILHLILQGMVYTEYTKILGCCQELDFSLYYLLLPYLLLIVNLVFFTLSCVTDPGTLTKANNYEFHEVMFPENTRCSACDLRRPAQSRPCVCGPVCAPFFPSLCIGAWNARSFLICLLTLVGGGVRLVPGDLMLMMLDTSKLPTPSLSVPFLTFPRIVFILGFVVVPSFLLGGFLCFALYLAITNQTVNEWYRGDRAWCQHCSHVARPPSAEPQVYQNIRSSGLWGNLGEIFLPAAAHYERKKK
uniref:Palmitoyltransferase n=1 Tax=Myotis lucifugus TaxID=59463 RepID=G1Q862_MYOLU